MNEKLKSLLESRDPLQILGKRDETGTKEAICESSKPGSNVCRTGGTGEQAFDFGERSGLIS